MKIHIMKSESINQELKLLLNEIASLEARIDAQKCSLKISQDILKKVQRKHKFISDLIRPNVSLSEIKLKDKDYYVIKGSYQIIDEQGNKIRMSVFVGRKDEFKHGKDDEQAISIAKEKISNVLIKKFPKIK